MSFESAWQWLHEVVLDNASTLRQYKRNWQIPAALESIDQLNKLSYPVERSTEGEYLPKLPNIQQGAIHILSAGMNSGKTRRIGADWVQAAKDSGWHILVLTPLNSLGQQTANDWGLPHIHSVSRKAERELWQTVRKQQGVVMCPDSLQRLPQWFRQKPILLILDEANQVIQHINEGDTLGSRWIAIQESFAALSQHAIQLGAIILSEDGIPDRAVNFIKEVSSGESVRVFTHRKQGVPWNTTIFSGSVSGYRMRLLEAAKQGKRLLFVTSSQLEAKRVERAISKLIPSLKVVRIDSETNEQGKFKGFFEAPDRWLEANQPNILILSPSAKSGVSIEGEILVEDAYFDSVWGHFPALSTDTHWQLLGRYRPSVPRFIFVPLFIFSSSDESLCNPRAIGRRLKSNARLSANAYKLSELLGDTGDRDSTMVRIESAVLTFLADSTAVTGLQKLIAHDALVSRLEEAGHIVKEEKLCKDSETATLWKRVQEEIWREDASIYAAITLDDSNTLEWARQQLDSSETTLEIRLKARKVLWREEFPGIQFDCPEECYRIVCQNYGAMRREVRSHAQAENLEATMEVGRKAVEAILSGNIKALHQLPKNHVKAALRANSGILNLLNGDPYTNADPRAIAVKEFTLKFANEIGYFLRLQVSETDTPVEICHKLLAQLGIKRATKNRPGAIAEVGRPGKRCEKRDRIYSINPDFDPLRTRLLEATRHKLSGSVSSTRKDLNPSKQATDTPPPSISSPCVGELAQWVGNGQVYVSAIAGEVAHCTSPDGEDWSIPLIELEIAA